MKFPILSQSLIFLVLFIGLNACDHGGEADQIQKLINKNLALGPQTDNTLLDIEFGDSRIRYQEKMDSLYKAGAVRSLVPDSLLSGSTDLSYYKYYYIFEGQEGLADLKWIFSPVFRENRLVELALITSSILEIPFGDRPLNLEKGILKKIIDASEEALADADITYRLIREHLNQRYGPPGFISKKRNQTYWFRGNCVISITNAATTLKIIFKNSESK